MADSRTAAGNGCLYLSDDARGDFLSAEERPLPVGFAAFGDEGWIEVLGGETAVVNGLQKQLQLWHLVLGLCVVVGGMLISAGATFEKVQGRLERLEERSSQFEEIQKTLLDIRERLARIEERVRER